MHLRAKKRIPRDLRRQKFSLLGAYHQALVIIKEMTKYEKELHKVHVHLLKRYSEDVVDKLTQEKLKEESKNPMNAAKADEDFRKKVQQLAKDFFGDLNTCYDLYIKIFSDLDKMVEFDDRAEAQDLMYVGKVLEKAVANHHETIFTEKSLEQFRKDFKKLQKKLVHDIKQDYRNDIYEKKDEKPKHLGMLNSRNDVKLAKMLKKYDKKLADKNEYWKWLGEKLEQELDKDKVMPDFMLLLDSFIDEFGEIEQIIRKIRLDMQILIHHHVIEHNKEAARSFKFKSVLKGALKDINVPRDLEEKMKRFYGEDDNEGIGAKAEEWANKEASNERVLYGQVKRDDDLVKAFLDKEEKKRGEMNKQAEAIIGKKAA